MSEERGVLEGLPRSRPGRRSDRRNAPTRPASDLDGGSSPGSGARSGGRSTGAASRSRSAGDAAASKPPRTGDRSSRPTAPEPDDAPVRDGEELLAGAARAAVSIGEAGVRAAARFAGGALRRLPRP